MIGDLGLGCTRGVCEGDDRRADLASTVRCILSQIDRPYPCAEQQTLTCDKDLQLPRERFKVFYGSFDWHSSVHSHWSLARLLADGVFGEGGCSTMNCCERGAAHAAQVATPESAKIDELVCQMFSQLDVSLEAERVAAETASWTGSIPAYFERPYGHTWLLALDAELARMGEFACVLGERSCAWREALAPLTAEMERRVLEWVRGLALPIRSGIHSDSAWSLAMAWDWAQVVSNAEMADAVREAAVRLYGHDVNAPVAYEPEGDTFTSAILNVAALMARVLDGDAYEAWMRGYMPQLFDEGREVSEPVLPDLAVKWDGVNHYGVHVVALPLSRALAARDAAAGLPEGSHARECLAASARLWMEQGLADLTLDGFLADHWVGSFVVASLAGDGVHR